MADVNTPEYFIPWCQVTFYSLAEGGVWGVPRSGLIFHKRGDKLVLVSRMPHDSRMPITEDELREQQQDEYESIKIHFAAAGITIEDAT